MSKKFKIRAVIDCLEEFAPIQLQEEYDNCGLLIGSEEDEISSVLTTLDVTEEIIEEAIQVGAGLIIAHHPILFTGIKKLNGTTYVERVIIKAIRHSIAIYACHTNADNVMNGVNHKIATKLGLINTRILHEKRNCLMKLVTFVPLQSAEKVKTALYKAGAGNIGNYSDCSFSVSGTGTFTPNEKSNPHIGSQMVAEKVEEERVELIFESHKQNKILAALKSSHPYEEVAYYLQQLQNTHQEIGSGMIGEFEEPIPFHQFIQHLKQTFHVNAIKCTQIVNENIKTVAFCGGSGSFLLKDAIRKKADVFLTADFTYHKFFDAEKKLVVCDIGHFETEQFTPELFKELLTVEFPNLKILVSSVNTNPVTIL